MPYIMWLYVIGGAQTESALLTQIAANLRSKDIQPQTADLGYIKVIYLGWRPCGQISGDDQIWNVAVLDRWVSLPTKTAVSNLWDYEGGYVKINQGILPRSTPSIWLTKIKAELKLFFLNILNLKLFGATWIEHI